MRRFLHTILDAADRIRPMSAIFLIISLSLILTSLTAACLLLGDHYMLPSLFDDVVTHILVSLNLALGFTLVLELALRDEESKKG